MGISLRPEHLKHLDSLGEKLVLAGPHYWGISEINAIISETNLKDDVVEKAKLWSCLQQIFKK